MKIRRLNRAELISIYQTHLIADFPAAEVKPLERILSLFDEGEYRAYGLFEGESLRAYAMIVLSPDGPYALLDYFAVVSGLRGKGYGSHLFEQLKSSLSDRSGMLLEVEDPDFAENDAERAIRERRIAFYGRLGAVMTPVLSCVMGVEYRILYLPIRETPDGTAFHGALDAIYHRILSLDIYQDHMRIM